MTLSHRLRLAIEAITPRIRKAWRGAWKVVCFFGYVGGLLYLIFGDAP